MLPKDYYKTLGINYRAGLQDIKKAYRLLALKYHPDKNNDGNYSDVYFKEIQEAYSVLSNKDKKNAYDEQLWLAGVKKTENEEIINASWLLNIAIELNNSLIRMDKHSINYTALKSYILLILSDAHIVILLTEKDNTINTALINELIAAMKELKNTNLEDIYEKLSLIANKEYLLLNLIEKDKRACKMQYEIEKWQPVIVFIVAIILCIFIFVLGK